MPGILICEDEENIVSFLQTELHFEGFATDVAFDGDEAIKKFASNAYDLILLDIMLPVRNGLEVLREIRKSSGVPVIILTARKEVYDKVAFLNAGADDYITKPFDTLELVARIKRNISRFAPHPLSSKNTLVVQKENYRSFINDNELLLTKTEFEILFYLYENKNKVKTRDEIINAVFGDFFGESNIVDVNIKNIRAKLQAHTADEVIRTVRGKGYVVLA
jgi:two-component system response regulator ArlR